MWLGCRRATEVACGLVVAAWLNDRKRRTSQVKNPAWSEQQSSSSLSALAPTGQGEFFCYSVFAGPQSVVDGKILKVSHWAESEVPADSMVSSAGHTVSVARLMSASFTGL